MSKFQVAHLREQGQDMIIVFVNKSVGSMSNSDRADIAASLQACAESAGLAGSVVLVWKDSLGRGHFVAPKPWHLFFESTPYDILARHINKELTCNGF